MCKPISGIILKDKILFSHTEHSHQNILAEYKIEDTKKNAENMFVRAELYPKNDDMFSNIDEWVFNVDQDIIPKWFVKDYEETRTREAVKKYAEEHIHIGKSNFELKDGTHWVKDCKNVIVKGTAKIVEIRNSTSKHYGSSTSKHYGSSTSKHYDSSTSKHYDSSTSKHYDSSTSKHYDSSTSEHYDSSTSKHYGSSTSILTEFSSNKRENITLLQNSTLKDCKTKTIYQSGDWKLVSVKGV